jgi:putative tricarboxylic transport membrane protein
MNQISSIFWLILGLAVIYGSYRLGLGTLTHPGPGFLSFWCAVILSGLSLLVFFQNVKAKRRGDQPTLGKHWADVRWSKSLYVVLATFAYSVTFNHLGFLLSTILLLTFLFKVVGSEKWILAIGGAVSASLISFVLFGLWLDVQLPRGLLERIFF